MTERKPIGGYLEGNEDSPIRENRDYYRGHIPKDEFPDYTRVYYTHCPYTGEPRTLITWQSVVPVATIDIQEAPKQESEKKWRGNRKPDDGSTNFKNSRKRLARGRDEKLA